MSRHVETWIQYLPWTAIRSFFFFFFLEKSTGFEDYRAACISFSGINACVTELKFRVENISEGATIWNFLWGLSFSSCRTTCDSSVSRENKRVTHESCFPLVCWRVMSTDCLFIALIQHHHLFQKICMSIVYLTTSGQEPFLTLQ